MSGQFAPCPSCSSNSSIHVAEWFSDDGTPTYYCVCDDCGYEDPDKFDDDMLAIDHWNRRVSKGYVDGDDPTDTEYDKLQEDDWSRSDSDGSRDNNAIKW